MTVRRVRDPEQWVLVAVARDQRTAEEWQTILGRRHIDAEVRFGDAAMAGAAYWGAYSLVADTAEHLDGVISPLCASA